jgi:hypothetical protein
MKLTKTMTQILLICLCLFEIISVFYLMGYMYFLAIEGFARTGIYVTMAQAALVYLVWTWIVQLNVYYRKSFEKPFAL